MTYQSPFTYSILPHRARSRQIKLKGRVFIMPRKTTYKRRPNNSGTVVKLSGKRRKPYCAKISSEERDIVTGKKKQVTIGTFETELEALNALSLII